MLRLTGDAVIALWAQAEAPSSSRFMAARELLARAAEIEQWYGRFGDGLIAIAAAAGGAAGVGSEAPLAPDADPLPQPRGADAGAERRLLATIDGDLRSAEGSATVTAVRIAWTGAFLDAVRRLEPTLLATVREAGEQGDLGQRPAPARRPRGGVRGAPRGVRTG